MDFLKIMSFGGAAVGLMLALHLAMHKSGHAAKLLALYLFCIAAFLLEPVSDAGTFKNILSVLLACLSFVAGPALFLYARSRFDPSAWKATCWIHFIPAIVLLILILLSLPLKPAPAEAPADELIL